MKIQKLFKQKQQINQKIRNLKITHKLQIIKNEINTDQFILKSNDQNKDK